MPSVTFSNNIFMINTNDSTYAFHINTDGRLSHLYYGAPITQQQAENLIIKPPLVIFFNHKDIMLPETSIYDGTGIYENTLELEFADGDRTSDCVYANHEITGDKLTITLKDKLYSLYISLNYTVHTENNIIEKSHTVTNKSGAGVFLNRAFSGSLSLPGAGWHLGTMYGGWAEEMFMSYEKLTEGCKVIESRTGSTSHFFNPSFFIDRKSVV